MIFVAEVVYKSRECEMHNVGFNEFFQKLLIHLEIQILRIGSLNFSVSCEINVIILQNAQLIEIIVLITTYK